MYEFGLEYPVHPSIPAPELRWAGPHTSLQEAQRSAQAEAGPLSWSEDGLHGTGEQCQVTIRPAFQMDQQVQILTPSYDNATGYVKSFLHGAVGVWIPEMHCDEDSVSYFDPSDLRRRQA